MSFLGIFGENKKEKISIGIYFRGTRSCGREM
jgi:hypothetical protein